MTIKFQTVPDTNIIIAAQSKNPKSPNREYYERWLYAQEFDFLYSDDTLIEYLAKLDERDFPEARTRAFLGAILKLGVKVYIEFFHLPVYPEDPDDTAFLLCAENGKATHLISYDRHLLNLRHRHSFDFKICEIVPFLQELRQNQD